MRQCELLKVVRGCGMGGVGGGRGRGGKFWLPFFASKQCLKSHKDFSHKDEKCLMVYEYMLYCSTCNCVFPALHCWPSQRKSI